MITVRAALLEGAELLERSRIPVARLTAATLLCHSLGKEREYLYAYPEAELSELAWIHYGRYLHERLEGKPTQYITKKQEFFGRDFVVSPAVLIPRPETEHLVETMLRLAPGAKSLVDVGCGSGAIGVTLALEIEDCSVHATDLSMDAIAVACANADRLGARVNFTCCDLLTAIRPNSMDFVASNPPYIPRSESLPPEVRDFEPEMALFGGETGFEIYARLIPQALDVLKPGGWLVMELGYRSLDGVRSLLGDEWHDIEVVPDLAGIPRVLAAQARRG